LWVKFSLFPGPHILFLNFALSVYNRLVGAGTFFETFRAKLRALRIPLKRRAGAAQRTMTGLAPAKLVRFIVIPLATLLLIFLGVLVVQSVARTKNEAEGTGFDSLAAAKIKESDLFLPPEPDFLPLVLLQQERKESWSAEDADRFWTDPSSFGAGVWESRMREYVDSLLESVP
jgi:hypothetical protein